MRETEIEPILVSVKTARRVTGLGNTKIYEMINAETVQTVKIGGRRLVVFDSLKRLGTPQVA